MRRSDHLAPSGDGACATWLTLPDGPGPHPALVVAHGFGMTRACRLDEFADAFAAAGIASCVFDYRGWGDSPGEPRQVLDLQRQRDDYRAVLAWARTREELDGTRLGLWGTSFSGGHVLSVAAEETGLAAVVAQVPFVDGPATLRGEGTGHPSSVEGADGPSAATTDGSARERSSTAQPGRIDRLRQVLRLSAAAARDLLRERLGRDPLLVPVAGEMDSAAVIAAPDALAQLRVLVPDGVDWRNEVAARVAAAIPRDQPGRRAADIAAPLLVVTCRQDRVTPPVPAWEAAARAPDGQLRTFDCRHFDVYVPPWRDRVLAAEIEWLRPQLGLVDGAARRPAG